MDMWHGTPRAITRCAMAQFVVSGHRLLAKIQSDPKDLKSFVLLIFLIPSRCNDPRWHAFLFKRFQAALGMGRGGTILSACKTRSECADKMEMFRIWPKLRIGHRAGMATARPVRFSTIQNPTVIV
jgi:hypothetical protein